MALYIKPPKGNIGFNKLCDLVKKRVNFLHFIRGKTCEEISVSICGEAFVSDSECIIDGSMKDRISHFVLRYLCVGHHGLQAFFIQSETELFVYRLQFYDFHSIRKLLQDALKQAISILRCQHVIKPYFNILQVLMDLIRDFDIALRNNFNVFKVPFTAVLNFVQRRLYPLNSGFIEVPLDDVKILLASIFEEVLIQGSEQMRILIHKQILSDSHMHYMERELISWFDSNVCNPINVLKRSVLLEENLNNESKHFPLCMANLHILLRKNHRLLHNSRVQYILFLKEIGMPADEVITLFRKEYSIPAGQPTSGKSCNHSWDCHNNRYIYSIEHLYGKRGARKDYKAHSCYYLQTLGILDGSSGGCPFVCFDAKSVHESSCSLKDIEDLKSLTSERRYAEACQSYMLKKISASYTSIDTSKLKRKVGNSDEEPSPGFVNNSNANLSHVDNKCFMKENSMQRTLVLKHSEAVISKPSEVYFIFSNSNN